MCEGLFKFPQTHKKIKKTASTHNPVVVLKHTQQDILQFEAIMLGGKKVRQRKKTGSTAQAFVKEARPQLWWRREGYAVHCTVAEMLAHGQQ